MIIIVVFSDDSSFKGFDGTDFLEHREYIANLIESFEEESCSIIGECGAADEDVEMTTAMTQKKVKHDTRN